MNRCSSELAAKPRLWLTYAWVDNADLDIDHIVAELERENLDVKLDRRQIIPGQRLWTSIDAAISDPTSVDAWAIVATEASLKSEPCIEELAYALDRALRKRGGEFPLIGIFPRPLDRELIPSAIVTRLYVTLNSPDWPKRVLAGACKRVSADNVAPPLPFILKWHSTPTQEFLEIRPRSGRWYPALILLPSVEKQKLQLVLHAPEGGLPAASSTNSSNFESDDGAWVGVALHHSVDPLSSLYVCFSSLPSEIAFGSQQGPVFTLSASEIAGIAPRLGARVLRAG